MRENRLLVAVVVGLFAAFVTALWTPLHDVIVIVNVGDGAPDFSVTTDSGARVTVRDFGGKALLLNFWATWCRPCVEEIPSLNALAQSLAPQGLVVLGVSSDTDAMSYTRFVRQAELRFPTAREPDRAIQLRYGTIQIPESYLIDRSGKVRAKFISNQNWTSPEIVSLARSLL
jgi:peroxiredoxin